MITMDMTGDDFKLKMNRRELSSRIKRKPTQPIIEYKNKYEIYKCKICKKAFTDKYNLQTHSQTHEVTCNYECDLCDYKGKTKKYLSRHKKKTHSEPTSNECGFCGKKFHYKSRLIQHTYVHTGEKPYKCEICDKAFNTSYSLNTHILIHTDEKPFECCFCEYACRDKSTLRKHEARHMGTERLYKCKICPQSYKVKYKLKEHVAEKHLDIDMKKFICDLCGKGFKWKYPLVNHIKSVHEKTRSCTCKLCGAKSSNRSNLIEHMRRHLEIRPYKCPQEGCLKSFKTTSELKKHTVIHSPEKYFACEKCGRTFSRRLRRDRHMTQTCATIARKIYKCHGCPRTFINEKVLSNHVTKEHKTVKKYYCDVCGVMAHSKRNLEKHMLHGHGGEDDKNCNLCDYVCEKMNGLKIHYYKMHNLKYRVLPKREKNAEDVEIKEEKVEFEEEEIDLLEIEKHEIHNDETAEAVSGNWKEEGSEEHFVRNTIEMNKTNLKKVPERIFDEYFIEHVFNHNGAKKDNKKYNVNPKDMEYVKNCIEKFLKRRKNTDRPVKKARTVTAGNNNDVNTQNEVDVEQNDNKKNNLKFNFHQCNVCYKLFPTRVELVTHCQEHFNVCKENMLMKCPLCQYATRKDIKIHIKERHDVDIQFSKIKEKIDSEGNSKFCLEVEGALLEVIPNVENLDKLQKIKFDKRKKELKDNYVGKKRLVKKDGEWFLEKVGIDKRDYVLPSFEYDGPQEYLQKIREISRRAKKAGRKMLFPCISCEKKCQTLSGLKLHFRRHEENPKPFKPKQWKHKMKNNVEKRDGDKGKRFCGKRIERSLKEIKSIKEEKRVSKNRMKTPKPIVNKHKCDKSLIDFYKDNIRGGDVEFGQFLKIYNRMTREKVKDFTDLEERSDFGIHLKQTEDLVDKPKCVMRVCTRILGLKREDYLRRERKKMELRKRVANGPTDTLKFN